MKCHVERAWVSHTVKVWLYDDTPQGIFRLSLDGQFTQVDTGTMPEPTLELREDALQALVAAASEIQPASDATTTHLKDAISVRDRLLALIEREAVVV